MKLVCDELQTTFNEEKFNIIVAEEVKTFRKLCEKVRCSINGEDCGLVLSDGDKLLNIAKCGMFVPDPLGVDFGEKKLINRLISELSATAEEKYGAEVDRIISDFSDLFAKLNGDSSVEIDWFDESPMAALFKAFGVSIKHDHEGFAEKIYNYMSAMTELGGIKAVFFVNIRSWLTESERAEIYKLLKYSGTISVSIESFASTKIEGEFEVIIDNDLCEIIS